MKNFILVFALLVSTHLGFAQSKLTPKEETAIKQLIVDTFQDLLSDYDSTKIDKHCTKDFLLLEHGEVWNNDTVRYYITQALMNENRATRTNQFEFIKFEKSGDMIWVAYDNWATWTKDDAIVRKMHWLESAVAVKDGKNWKLKMMHSTRIENE